MSDPVSSADFVELHLTVARRVGAEPVSELLAIVVKISSGTPNPLSASARARQTARPVARSTTFAITQNRE
jgi:hypothetical protein